MWVAISVTASISFSCLIFLSSASNFSFRALARSSATSSSKRLTRAAWRERTMPPIVVLSSGVQQGCLHKTDTLVPVSVMVVHPSL